jgi:hypothetical protein
MPALSDRPLWSVFPLRLSGFVSCGSLPSADVETFLEALPLLSFLRFPPWFPVSGGNFPVETFAMWKLKRQLDPECFGRVGTHPTYRFRILRWFSFLLCVLFRTARIDGALLGTHAAFLRTVFAYRSISHRGGLKQQNTEQLVITCPQSRIPPF